MKKNLIIILLLFSCLGFSQTNSLLGKWKVASIDNGEVFYNMKTDSILISSEEMKERYSTEPEVKILKDLMKKLYADHHFNFDANGILNLEMNPAGTMQFEYKDDQKRKVIVVKDKNSYGEPVAEEISYKFVEEQLHLILNFTEPPGLYILEKEKE